LDFLTLNIYVLKLNTLYIKNMTTLATELWNKFLQD
jgi:hypothetical protein